MRFTPRILVVDVGAAHVACARFAADQSGRLTLRRFAQATHAADPGQEAAWRQGTAEMLRTLGDRESFRGRCTLALPGHLALTRQARIPALAAELRPARLAEFAAAGIPQPLTEVVWQVLETADDGKEVDLLLAAAKPEAVDELGTTAGAAGLLPQEVEAGVLALWRAYRYNYRDASAPALIIDIGARSTHLIVIQPGGRARLRTVPLGGNTVTQGIAAKLGLDFTAAEAMKRQAFIGGTEAAAGIPAETAGAISRAGENFSARLEFEITRSLAGLAKESKCHAPDHVLLTGGGALIPGLAERLAVKLQMPAAPYDALREVSLTDRAKADGAVLVAHHLPVLVGLAAGAIGLWPQPAGLLTPKMKSRRLHRRRQPWWLATAALLALIPVPMIWHYHAKSKAVTVELAKVESELANSRRQEKAGTTMLAHLEQLQRETEAMNGLAERRAHWLGFLADVQIGLAQVEGVWLDSLQRVPPVTDGRNKGEAEAAMRMRCRGRLLDREHPQERVGGDAFLRIKALTEAFRTSPYIAEVTDEHFDGSEPGLLHFEFTIVNDQRRAL